MSQAGTEIAIVFKEVPHVLFSKMGHSLNPNILLIRIQPDEGISFTMSAKRPGSSLHIEPVKMDFHYGSSFGKPNPEAYERLLLDALRGDAALFTRSDEVEYSWRFVTAIHEAWANLPSPSFPNYYPFTDGPDEANRLLEGTQARWRSLRDA